MNNIFTDCTATQIDISSNLPRDNGPTKEYSVYLYYSWDSYNKYQIRYSIMVSVPLQLNVLEATVYCTDLSLPRLYLLCLSLRGGLRDLLREGV